MRKLPIVVVLMLAILALAVIPAGAQSVPTLTPASAEPSPSPILIPPERTEITPGNLDAVKRLATWGSGAIYDAAWMDNDRIAFTSDAGTWVYELGQTALPTRLFTPPAQTVFASPSPDWLLTYTDNENYDPFYDYALIAWNMTGESKRLLGENHTRIVDDGSYRSPVIRSYGVTGGYVVASQGADVYLWRGDFSGEPLRFAQPPSNRTRYVVESAVVSDDGKWLAMAARAFLSDQLIISVWDTESGDQHIIYQDEYLPLARQFLYNMQFSADGHELVATLGETDDSYRLEIRVARWEVPSGKALEPLELLCADRDGKDVAVGITPSLYAADLYLCQVSPSTSIASFEIRSIKTEELQASVDVGRYYNIPVFSPDAQYMALSKPATSSGGSRLPYQIMIWDIAHDRLSAEFEIPTGSVAALEFSPDGRLLVANSEGRVFIWDIEAQAQTYLIDSGHSLAVTSVAFSPDGRWLVSASTTRYKVTQSYDAPGGFVARWNLETSQYEKLLDGVDTQVQSIVFSPDGKYLYLGDIDGNLRIWDSATFAPLDTVVNPDSIRNMSFNSDGSLLAVSGDHQVTIWDTQTRTIINRLQGSSGNGYCTAQFSADDNWLKLCNKAWKVENHGKLIAAWSMTDLPQEVQDWVWMDEGKLAFPSPEGDGATVYAAPIPYYEPREASIAFNPAHDLIAVGCYTGVIEIYGIVEGGS